MRLLLDTHLLVWGAMYPDRVPEAARALVLSTEEPILFSPVTIWEVAVKFALGRPDFAIPPDEMLTRLITAGYEELPVTSAQALRVLDLPLIHRDPFDRLLLAQAIAEGATLVTADDTLARYPGPILRV